jgi:type II secretory pathway component PulF
MATFKYQAVLPTGVSVFGDVDADDLHGLVRYLTARNLTLVNASELKVSPVLTTNTEALPRMLQLRVGDRLREALLTDMPAHEAVGAIAEEPFEHPILLLMPWLFFASLVSSVVMCLLAVLIPQGRFGLWVSAAIAPTFMGTLWIAGHYLFVVRPRNVLRKIAARMERGDDQSFTSLGILPVELRAVIDSNVDSRSKATSIAELTPAFISMHLKTHQFAARMLAPVIAMSVLLIGIHVVLLSVMPQFGEIFQSFGLELPVLTQAIMGLSGFVRMLGLPGIFGMAVLLISALAVFYLLLVMPQTAEIWESIPVLGWSVRWLMQARVSRMLGILIRNKVDPANAILIASRASGFSSVAADGRQLAAAINKGTHEFDSTRQLSGLPLSLLLRVSDSDSEAARQQTSHAFQSYAAALEQASEGNGSFLAVLFELFIVLTSGTFVAIIVLACFLPLIKLLNDLSVGVWWLR